MNEITDISDRNTERALRIIDELRINEIWEASGSVCNLVGSVKTRLLMEHLDIDFHVYSDDFSIAKSFQAISAISESHKIKEVTYKNLLDAEDVCLEWHLLYEESPQQIWTIDIIHIRNDSPYAGMIERVTAKIEAMMTGKLREAILRIKWEIAQNNEKVPGIEIYEAVIGHGIGTYNDFKAWQKGRRGVRISLWEP